MIFAKQFAVTAGAKSSSAPQSDLYAAAVAMHLVIAEGISTRCHLEFYALVKTL